MFPKAIEEIWGPLQSEVLRLSLRWDLYKQLYGTKEEYIEILKKSSSVSFGIIQDVLMSRILLDISKVSDKPSTVINKEKHYNLSINLLHERLLDINEIHLINKLNLYKDNFDKYCDKIRNHRHKYIAHNDLDTKIFEYNSSIPVPIVGSSRADIQGALNSLYSYLNTIQLYYKNSQTMYKESIDSKSGGRGIIVTLKQGLRYRELLDENIITHEEFLSLRKSI